jgi:type I restriction enzyme M protein
MDSLGRFYTETTISSLLINNFEMELPSKILDLGIGNASLTIAAYSKWENAEYFATEIEKVKTKKIREDLAFIKIYNYDTLKPNLSKTLKVKLGSIDIAICNPPYVKIKEKAQYLNLFKSIGCVEFMNLKLITSEIVFLAHNLKLLRQNGELGIIVSDSLITGKEFRLFRSTILKNFFVRRIIQLPDNVFKKTEARTHIIFISKKKSDIIFSELCSYNVKGELTEGLFVKREDLFERMDFKFHQYLKSSTKGNIKTFKDINVEISRGKMTHKELKALNMHFFHSTNFRNSDKYYSFNHNEEIDNRYIYAKKGDILMCRVGKRTVGTVGIIVKGNVLISDCIYRIAVPKRYQKVVWDSLNCDSAKIWLQAYTHGVCAQVLSKSDLENFPLFTL